MIGPRILNLRGKYVDHFGINRRNVYSQPLDPREPVFSHTDCREPVARQPHSAASLQQHGREHRHLAGRVRGNIDWNYLVEYYD